MDGDRDRDTRGMGIGIVLRRDTCGMTILMVQRYSFTAQYSLAYPWRYSWHRDINPWHSDIHVFKIFIPCRYLSYGDIDSIEIFVVWRY